MAAAHQKRRWHQCGAALSAASTRISTRKRRQHKLSNASRVGETAALAHIGWRLLRHE